MSNFEAMAKRATIPGKDSMFEIISDTTNQHKSLEKGLTALSLAGFGMAH